MRTAIALQMLRAATLINEGIKDIPAKIKTEIFLKKSIFGSADNMNQVITNAADLYGKLTLAEQRSLDTTFRDIIESFWNEIRTLSAEDKTFSDALKILDDYIEFKTKIDTVSPETAAEVDRLANMTDEEFEVELNKPDEEDEEDEEEDEEEETEQVDTPITLADFNNLSIVELVEKYGSHDTALCLIDAEGGEEKINEDIDDGVLMMDQDDVQMIYDAIDNGSVKNHLHFLLNYAKFNCSDVQECIFEAHNALLVAQEASMNGTLPNFPGVEEEVKAMMNMSPEELKEKFARDDAVIADAKQRAEEALKKAGIEIPDTSEFNPDYDIPDEKLYPQE